MDLTYCKGDAGPEMDAAATRWSSHDEHPRVEQADVYLVAASQVHCI